MSDFDAIVIGSGIGGLTAASLLARLHGHRVLVLERHFRAGGFTHTFSRPGGYHWDVGVHYVGDLAPGSLTRQVMDVVTDGAQWQRLEDPFERLVFPGLTFDMRSGTRNLREDLLAAFPAERAGLTAYFRDVPRAASVTGLAGMPRLLPAPARALAQLALSGRRRLAAQLTSHWLDTHVQDPRLKALLGARWGDFGLPPGQGAFGMHSVIARHYFEGAWYPVGSAAQLAKGAARVITQAGGQVRVNAGVERILLEQGRAVGVRLADGEELRAPLIISGAGARTTYLRLLEPSVPLPFRDTLAAMEPSMAHVTVYLGLSQSARTLGLHGQNLWLHDTLDHDAIWRGLDDALRGTLRHAYVSFPSDKDPRATAHTAEVVFPVSHAPFARWAKEPWRRRGAEYDALKVRLAETALGFVERHVPGLRDLVRFTEVSTPLSTAAFTGHQEGEIYGIPFSPRRFDLPWLGTRTPLPGLLLAGADAQVLGVVGAMMGGMAAVVAAKGWKTFRDVQVAAQGLDARAG